MITLSHLSVSYDALQVYDDFSFSFEEGKITCLLGESGCGKTTLLNALAGLVPCRGELPNSDCSYVFQEPRLVPHLTVTQNLSLVQRDKRRVREMVSLVGLSDKANAYPVRLSGGQAQRVSVARAFLTDAPLLLLDEPFSSLDVKTKLPLMKLVAELCRTQGKTALFVTHNVDEALSLAHRVVVMKKGHIVWDASLEGEVPRPYGASDDVRQRIMAVLSE